MIGKIIIGKSFRGCISYCLENKVIKAENDIIKNRSEILSYNLCYGDKLDLIKQFNEVRNLNPKLSKPVMHITLSFAEGEQVPTHDIYGIIEDCAKDLGFHSNQYVAIAHNDTTHQHLHIVANRVGFDGKTVKDNHNYQKMATYCRRMELKHNLKQVLSPRRFQTAELRKLPRFDARKEQLRKDIIFSVQVAKNYPQFEQLMNAKGYAIQRARGIVFYDSKKVRTKGSDVGFSLSRIEKLLALSLEQKMSILQNQKTGKAQTITKQHKQSISLKNHPVHSHSISEKIYELLKPELQHEADPSQLLKKKKKKRGYHL